MNLKRSIKLGLVSILAILLLAVGPAALSLGLSSSPRPQIRVPQDFPTIQEAINVATPGSVILIAVGTYQENLVVDRPLTLRGEAQDRVIIGEGDGCRNGEPAISVASERVRLEEFTVTKCSIGIGIRGTAEMNRLILSGNAIGLEVWDSAEAALEDSLVVDNTVGIEVWAMANASIADSSIENNGIGVKVLRGSSVAILGSRIAKNGLGAEVWDSDEVLVEGSIISENKGDGLWAWGPASTRIAIQGNAINQNGGNGIRLGTAGYRPDSIRAEIEGNMIQKNVGCGVWVDAEEDIQLTGRANALSGNRAGELCPEAYPWPSDFTTGS